MTRFPRLLVSLMLLSGLSTIHAAQTENRLAAIDAFLAGQSPEDAPSIRLNQKRRSAGWRQHGGGA